MMKRRSDDRGRRHSKLFIHLQIIIIIVISILVFTPIKATFLTFNYS